MKSTASQPTVIWLVGASSGIGLSLVERWLSQGCRVVASARTAETSEPLASLKQRFPESLQCLNLDVTATADEAALKHAVDQAWAFFGRVDVWFYNAGVYVPGAWEAMTWDDYRQMTQVNYLGCVALQLALRDVWLAQGRPPMRWVWNLSIANQVGLPYGGGYSAPKAALLNLAESLQPELAQKGIRLQVVNHGFVKTRLTEKNDFAMPGLMSVEAAAERIADWLDRPTSGFELHFPKKLTLFLKVLRCLPSGLRLAVTRRLLHPRESEG
ncbi:MAG: SDR family NAD(P)-dependent oxidoreductase [Hydrogenovibrio sp.]